MTVERLPTGRDIVVDGDIRSIYDLTPDRVDAARPHGLVIEGGSLTPSQAGDVLRWAHDGANAEERDHGYRDRVGLGRAAWLAMSQNPKDFVPGMTEPLFTASEAAAALAQSQH